MSGRTVPERRRRPILRQGGGDRERGVPNAGHYYLNPAEARIFERDTPPPGLSDTFLRKYPAPPDPTLHTIGRHLDFLAQRYDPSPGPLKDPFLSLSCLALICTLCENRGCVHRCHEGEGCGGSETG